MQSFLLLEKGEKLSIYNKTVNKNTKTARLSSQLINEVGLTRQNLNDHLMCITPEFLWKKRFIAHRD